MTIAVIFDRFGPYHCRRLEAAASAASIIGIELAADSEDYPWDKIAGPACYERVTVVNEGGIRHVPYAELSSRLEKILEFFRPAAVAIPGWSDKGALAALIWCGRTGTRAILMSESTAHDHPRRWWKEFVKRRLIRRYTTALVGGRLHREYLQQLGMPPGHIFTGYDVVDNEHFAGQSRASLAHPDDAHETQFGFGTDVPFFLASARFIKKKNLFMLLRAYAAYRKEALEGAGASGSHRPWNLVVLGDGPLRAALLSELVSLQLDAYVQLPGFRQYEELPGWYQRASAFVHASTTEQWGLVVNEAVAAGLPVIVSNRCGCVPELVRVGVNGFTFNPADQDALVECLTRMAGLSGTDRARFGSASREVALCHEPARFGRGLLRAATLALELPATPEPLWDHLLVNLLAQR